MSGLWGDIANHIHLPPGKSCNEKALEGNSLFPYSSADPNDDWRDCEFLIGVSERREKNRREMHIVSARLSRAGLGWAQPSVRQNCGALPDTRAPRLGGANQHTRQGRGTLAESQYGNVYTCSKPCSRIPPLHNQPRSPGLIQILVACIT